MLCLCLGRCTVCMFSLVCEDSENSQSGKDRCVYCPYSEGSIFPYEYSWKEKVKPCFKDHSTENHYFHYEAHLSSFKLRYDSLILSPLSIHITENYEHFSVVGCKIGETHTIYSFIASGIVSGSNLYIFIMSFVKCHWLFYCPVGYISSS